MNLIQIKQIDGLNASLNSLASAINNLDTEVNEKIDERDNFWNQIYFTSDQVIFNGSGEAYEGLADISLVAQDGGVVVEGDSHFLSSLSVTNDLLLTSSTGQLVYLDKNSNPKRLGEVISPNYRSVETSSLTNEDYIVGVDSSTFSQTVTLPAPSEGKEIIIKDASFNASLNNITVSPNSTEFLDNNVNFVISGDGGFASFYSDGSSWFLNSSDNNDLSALVESNHSSLSSQVATIDSNVTDLESAHDSRIDHLESNSQIINSYTTGTLPTTASDGQIFLATDGEGLLPAMVYYYAGDWYRASDNVRVAP